MSSSAMVETSPARSRSEGHERGPVPATVFTFHLSADGTPSFPFVSAGCGDLYGFSAEEAMADVRLMHDAVHPRHRASFDKAGQHSLRTLRPLYWEGCIVHPDGDERPVLITSEPRRLADGSTEWHGVVMDRRGEAAATPRFDAAAHEAPLAYSDALGMLGHDIGAPLTAILGSAELALEVLDDLAGGGAVGPDAVVRKCLQVIARQGHRLDYMRRDLVTVASADGDAIRARPTPTALTPCLKAAADLAGSIDVRIECPPDLHCSVQDSHLGQMLANLVSNARRYARSRLVLRASRAGDRVSISVEDDGPGIPAAVIDRLFMRFSHAGAATLPPGAGTGLGLYIVRTLASANEGTVLYTPTGRGSRFTIVLPAADPQPS